NLSNSCRLPRRQNSKTNSFLRQDVESLKIYGRFRQPHALCGPAEPVLKIAKAPPNLRHFVGAIEQGHDCVVVCLCHRGTVAGESILTFAIGFQNQSIYVRALLLKPMQQSWTKVEANRGVIVDQSKYATITVQDSGNRVRSIALGSDAFIPV